MSAKLSKVKIFLVFSAVLFLYGCTRIQTITQTEIIPFKSSNVEDPKLVKGTTKVKQAGVPGIRQAVFKEKYSGGDLISRVKVTDKIIENPVNEVVQVGTAPPIVFTVTAGGSIFEISLSACGRKDEITLTNKLVKGDFLSLKGTLKNTGAKAAKSGSFLDLAAIHPAIKGGVSYLTIAAVPQLLPGQTVEVQWTGTINPGAAGKNAAIANPDQVKVIPRALAGAKKKPGVSPKLLEGLAEN